MLDRDSVARLTALGLKDDEALIVEDLELLALHVHANAVNKGFWEETKPLAVDIALMHSELSEMLEGERHSNPPSDHIPEFSAVEEEAADVVIRLLDNAAARGWRIGPAILAKHRYNCGRPHKHGKAF